MTRRRMRYHRGVFPKRVSSIISLPPIHSVYPFGGGFAYTPVSPLTYTNLLGRPASCPKRRSGGLQNRQSPLGGFAQKVDARCIVVVGGASVAGRESEWTAGEEMVSEP
jgi:hypothetical protein